MATTGGYVGAAIAGGRLLHGDVCTETHALPPEPEDGAEARVPMLLPKRGGEAPSSPSGGGAHALPPGPPGGKEARAPVPLLVPERGDGATPSVSGDEAHALPPEIEGGDPEEARAPVVLPLPESGDEALLPAG